MRPRRDRDAAPLTFGPNMENLVGAFLPPGISLEKHFPFSVFSRCNVCGINLIYLPYPAITSLTAPKIHFMCLACSVMGISMSFPDITRMLVATARYRWVLHPAGCLFYSPSVGNKSIKRIISRSLLECLESGLKN